MEQESDSFIKWGQQGKTLVFLHYFGGAASSWQWTIEHLCNDYQCIALNLPGFGDTPPLQQPTIEHFAQWIAKTLLEHDVDSCTLIGHSMSGKLSLEVAAQHPELNTEQVILVAPSPPTTEPMPEEEKERMLQHPNLQEAEKTVKQASIKSLSEEKKKLATYTQLIIDHPTWIWWLQDGMNHSIEGHLPKVKVPVSVIASKDDPAIPYKSILSDVIGLLPQAKLISTEQIGHLIPLEDPEWLAQQIRAIVSE